MTAQRVQQQSAMWASDAQRDRAFEMIGGTPSVTLHRKQHARLDAQRRRIAGLLVFASAVWLAVAAFIG